MVEAAKEILEMVKHMPEYTLWVLIGILLYKVVIIGSWFGVARLLILKVHEYMMKPKIIEYDFNGVMLDKEAKIALIDILEQCKRHTNRKASFISNYFHEGDLRVLRSGLRDQIQKDLEADKQKPNPFQVKT